MYKRQRFKCRLFTFPTSKSYFHRPCLVERLRKNTPQRPVETRSLFIKLMVFGKEQANLAVRASFLPCPRAQNPAFFGCVPHRFPIYRWVVAVLKKQRKTIDIVHSYANLLAFCSSGRYIWKAAPTASRSNRPLSSPNIYSASPTKTKVLAGMR